MAKVGDKYILHSSNGTDYDIEIINVNYFRPSDVYDGNGVYAGDVLFFGEEFLSKCEKVN